MISFDRDQVIGYVYPPLLAPVLRPVQSDSRLVDDLGRQLRLTDLVIAQGQVTVHGALQISGVLFGGKAAMILFSGQRRFMVTMAGHRSLPAEMRRAVS